ncbi:MAG: hypothetical protein QOG66_3564 [Methylobacteriaceae bacterium]|jgi:hypothetical protein|nr:hypothetical protein [Methylobacteriaceae bacterium]
MVEVTESEGSFFRVVIPPSERGIRPRYIEFQPVPHVDVPPDVSALQIEIEKTLATLIMLFPETGFRRKFNQAQYGQYFDKVAGIAVAGLGQDQTVLGSMALEALKQEIVTRESGRIKNSYIRKLGSWCVFFMTVTGAVYAVPNLCGGLPQWVLEQREFLTLILGSFLGTWLSFSIRNVELTFPQLAVMERDQLDPPIRLLFVAGLTLVIGLIFATGLASITIGSFTTAFLNSGRIALLIGLFCGISEQALSTTVGAKASEFMGLLARGTAQSDQRRPPEGGGEHGSRDAKAPVEEEVRRNQREEAREEGRGEANAPMSKAPSPDAENKEPQVPG